MQCPNCGPDMMMVAGSNPPRCGDCGAVLVPSSTTVEDFEFQEFESYEEAELLESGEYDDVLDDLQEEEDSYRLSDEEMREETLRATMAETVVAPLEPSPSGSLEEDLAEERRVPLGAETTVSDKPVVPPSFPLRMLLWNIADLGGGPSGTLPVRKAWTISALAHVIRTANPDIVTILELKKKGGTRLVEPKPPAPMKQNSGRSSGGNKLPALETLARDFIVPEDYKPKRDKGHEAGRIKALEEALLNDLARLFSEHVRRAIWPGASKESPLGPDWSEVTQGLGAEKLATIEDRLDAAWEACEPDLVKRFGRPPEKDEEEDEEDPPEALVAMSIDVKGKKQPKLDAYCKLCVRLLLEEGYYDWLQPYEARYSSKEKDVKKLGPEAAEKEKRDELAKLGVDQLRQHCGVLFHRFLAVVAGLDPKKVPGTRQIVLENSLHRSNDEHLQRVYEAKHAEYLERKSEMEDAPESHAGLREFLRIRDALNAQCKKRGEEPYASWPEEAPDKPVKGLYTQDEAYGVLWRKSKVEVDASAISYLSAYVARRGGDAASDDVTMTLDDDPPPVTTPVESSAMNVDGVEEEEGGVEPSAMNVDDVEEEAAEREEAQPSVKSLYTKREPIRIPVRLAQVKGSPVVSVVAWHPPAPGDRNKNARGKDFRAFLQYCQDERKEKALGVVLSDLNIDTARPKAERAKDGTPYIDTCVERLSFGQFFQTLLGPEADASHLYALAPQLSTIAKSKFGAWAVDNVSAFGEGSKLTLRAFLKTKVDATTFAPAEGRKVPLPLESSEDVLAYIESFITPPQQRYGASGYDKILVYSRRTDGWSLEQSSVFVIPFPMALADEKEKGLFFIHGKLLPKHLQPFWRLIQTEDAELPEDERIFDKLRASGVQLKGSDDARWEEVMVASKKLSDHMPLVSDLRLVYSGEEALVIEEVELVTDTVSTELSELEALCAAYQRSTSKDDAAVKELDAILDAAAKVPESDHARSNALVAEAMQWRETFDVLRADGFDPEDHWVKRPALKSDGGAKGKANGGLSLDAHLTSQGQARVRNAGGGDCLFRSLSQLLYGTEAHHGAVRQSVVNHLEDLLAGQSLDAGGLVGTTPAETFRQDLGLLLDWHREAWPNEPAYRRVAGVDPWRQYLRAMSRDRAWGDHVALAAASHLFRVRFHMYARTGPAAFWTDLVDFVPRTEGHEARPTLLLANLGNAHYEAVGPVGMELVAQAFPGELAELSVRRRRDEGPAPQSGSGKTEAKTQPASTLGASPSSSDPSTKGPVCLWPHTVWFDPHTPARHPHALFLFGENDVAKQKKYFQSTTQAVIRMNPNAVGIRTCWVAGAGMLDKDLARNQKAIDDDCEEARKLLEGGTYTTLVVPWNHASKHVDIGTNTANLPLGAPKTWAHLKKKIDELMAWANKHLGTVLVVPQTNALVPSVVRSQASDLHLQEVSDAMFKAASVGDDSSTSVVKAPNVASLRTLLFPGASSPETGLLADADYEKNKAMLDEDLDALTKKVESGQFKRLVLNRDEGGRIVLGTELGQLDKHAPRTLNYLRERLEALCKRCEQVHVASSESLPKGDRRSSPDVNKRKRGADDEDATQELGEDAWGSQEDGSSFKKPKGLPEPTTLKRKWSGPVEEEQVDVGEEEVLPADEDVLGGPPLEEEEEAAEPNKKKKKKDPSQEQ